MKKIYMDLEKELRKGPSACCIVNKADNKEMFGFHGNEKVIFEMLTTMFINMIRNGYPEHIMGIKCLSDALNYAMEKYGEDKDWDKSN
jgi:hypothetical protein